METELECHSLTQTPHYITDTHKRTNKNKLSLQKKKCLLSRRRKRNPEIQNLFLVCVIK